MFKQQIEFRWNNMISYNEYAYGKFCKNRRYRQNTFLNDWSSSCRHSFYLFLTYLLILKPKQSNSKWRTLHFPPKKLLNIITPIMRNCIWLPSRFHSFHNNIRSINSTRESELLPQFVIPLLSSVMICNRTSLMYIL